MRNLIEEIFVSAFSNDILCELGDSAVIRSGSAGKLAFTTDSFVVKPLFFRGGDIGRLAVCGTVNDLAVAGARPRFLSVSMIIEEGFPISLLKKITRSVTAAAREADVVIATGDTKVVERGAAEGIFITTAGVGDIPEHVSVGPERIDVGDAVLVNGFIGDHGVALILGRGEYDFKSDLESDVAPLAGMIESILMVCPGLHFMRDLTRGGIAAALNEVASASGKAIEVDEAAIPVRHEVSAVCHLLGIDPLNIGNEGKCIIICPARDCDTVLAVMQRHEYGRTAAVIGRVIEYGKAVVIGRTAIGSKRIIDMPSGRLLPRIC
ncbi:MAG: hydrogenase expression/formation protein HypE [Candidatus Abyssobacteria bacterium SURF_5]|uniref:Hydrogenase expression/formation protein HypE n=1 Tax=Abyssobacteria bacterium (strain SURF_5) TaxID=2093360 RepID=A0A3A4NUT3_ABYX5|nr:MAG: hydrogenase expression/formation protein HypE [Candidatus Abyssubacteria bacterium SURF_5]